MPIMIKKYTAILVVNQKRDVNTSSPKILLKNVLDLGKNKQFRDHCFVSLDRRLKTVIDSAKTTEVKIEFTAKTYSYVGSNGKNKSLKQIRNITVVKE